MSCLQILREWPKKPLLSPWPRLQKNWVLRHGSSPHTYPFFPIPCPSSSTFFPLFSFILLFLHLSPISSPSLPFFLLFSPAFHSLPFIPPSLPPCHALSFPPTFVRTLPFPLPVSLSTHSQQAPHTHVRASHH